MTSKTTNKFFPEMGAPYRNQFLWMFRMKDGLVIEAEAFLDLVAYQQVVENNEPRPQ
ncbi:hypothetical protein OSH11_04480 [Kaistia dalseonensis]|uniref:Ketosteroid isomerase-like protein n=1 Tax=Kaistia dalseonensis TaxID=410840 RepID=A0ABU0H2I8_9HYPH|nr:hypothetical protein [Kaistia dalseonensis]MDQ0436519.1 ketosteroid isomerase-like protein [Kaistia dalseonensis]